jgi:hypothetical protein
MSADAYVAPSLTVTSPGGAQTYYLHYVSTYCIHDKHGDCRLTCKHCKAPCLCPCHRAEAPAETGASLPPAEADGGTT